MASLRIRTARIDDAEKIALLHADSWRRHYRGVFADSFLDGDISDERRAVWASRLAGGGNMVTIIAEGATDLGGNAGPARRRPVRDEVT